MSILKYISLPSNLIETRASYIKEREEDEFCVNTNPSECLFSPNTSFIESEICILDKEDATFDKCFNNPFIYRLYMQVVDYYSKQISEVSQRYREKEDNEGCLDENTMAKRDQEIKKYWDKEAVLYNQTLYKFLQENLKIGEFAEIYTAWTDHISFDFAPPTSEQTINLKDLLKITSYNKTIGIDERAKKTIIKTE